MYTATNGINSPSRIQNPYAPSVAASSISKRFSDSIAEAIYTPLAGSQSESQYGVTPENFYDTIADLAVSPRVENKFLDMYVSSSAHLCCYSYSERALIRSDPERFTMEVSYRNGRKKEQAIKKRGCIEVPIGAGEFPQFMEEIRQDLANGLSLVDALQNRIDAYKKNYHTQGIGSNNADLFCIDPKNGDVAAVWPKGRVTRTADYNTEFTDEAAGLELADDLATFLRYAAFGQEEDDPERVEQLMSYLQSKQAYANYDRYIFDLDGDERVDNTAMANQIIARLIAAGVLKGDDEEEEEGEAIDGLIEAIRVHQEELRENQVDIKGSERIAAELREIMESDRTEFLIS